MLVPRALLLRWVGHIPADLYWTFALGDSMEPWIPDGSPILVEGCRTFAGDGRYIVWFDDYVEQVKRFELLGNRRIRMISDNPAYAPRELRMVEEDIYLDEADANGHHFRMIVRGRVLLPPDTSHAVVRMLMLSQAAR